MKKILLMLFITLVVSLATNLARAQIVRIDGSSTVFPITEAVADEFPKKILHLVQHI